MFNKQHGILLKIQQSKVHCFTFNFQQFTPRATSWTWDFPQKICTEMYDVKILCLRLSFLWCRLSNLDPVVNYFIFSLDSIIYILTSSPFQNSAKFQPRVNPTICCMLPHWYQNAEKFWENLTATSIVLTTNLCRPTSHETFCFTRNSSYMALKYSSYILSSSLSKSLLTSFTPCVDHSLHLIDKHSLPL